MGDPYLVSQQEVIADHCQGQDVKYNVLSAANFFAKTNPLSDPAAIMIDIQSPIKTPSARVVDLGKIRSISPIISSGSIEEVSHSSQEESENLILPASDSNASRVGEISLAGSDSAISVSSNKSVGVESHHVGPTPKKVVARELTISTEVFPRGIAATGQVFTQTPAVCNSLVGVESMLGAASGLLLVAAGKREHKKAEKVLENLQILQDNERALANRPLSKLGIYAKAC